MGYPAYFPKVDEEPVDIKAITQQLIDNHTIQAYMNSVVRGATIPSIPSDKIASMDAQIYFSELNARKAIDDNLALMDFYESLKKNERR